LVQLAVTVTVSFGFHPNAKLAMPPFISSLPPWLPLYPERCGSFWVDAQSFSFAAQL
jgi:hypothetical protein